MSYSWAHHAISVGSQGALTFGKSCPGPALARLLVDSGGTLWARLWGWGVGIGAVGIGEGGGWGISGRACRVGTPSSASKPTKGKSAVTQLSTFFFCPIIPGLSLMGQKKVDTEK